MSKKKQIQYGRGVVGPDYAVRKYERFVYPLGDGVQSIVSLFMSMYFLFYATTVMGIDPAIAGTMTLVARIFDALNDPVMGLVADRTDTRFGTYRPYVIFGSWTIGLSIIMLFAMPANLSMGAKIAWMWVFYILENMAVTFVGIPYKGMMTHLTNHGPDRVFINRNCLIYSYLFALIGAIVVPMAIGALSAVYGPESGMPYTISICVIMVVCTVLFTLVGITVKERQFTVAKLDGGIEKPKVGESLKLLFKNKYWYIITGCALFNYFISGINTTVTLYYTNYVLKAGSILSMITMVANFGIPMIVMLIVPRYTVKWGKRKMGLIGISIAIAGMLLRLIVGIDASVVIYTLGLFMFNGGIAAYTTCQAPGMMDCIEYSEWKFGVRNDGIIMSGYLMASKAGPGLASALTGYMLKAIHFDKTVAASDAVMQQGIFNIAVLWPMIFLIAFFLWMTLWNLDKKQPQIRADLAERRAAVAAKQAEGK